MQNPRSVLADALTLDDGTEDGVIDEEQVRRTVRPLATELLDWRQPPQLTIMRLEALASLEVAHKSGLAGKKRHES